MVNRLIFRHPFLRPPIRAMDAVLKTKAIPDCFTVLRMLRVLGKGGVVGLFPEGGIPWNGVNQEFALGTAKLLVKVGVPVVFAHIQGAWMQKSLFFPVLRLFLFNIRKRSPLQCSGGGGIIPSAGSGKVCWFW